MNITDFKQSTTFQMPCVEIIQDEDEEIYEETYTRLIDTVKNVQWYHLYISRGLIKPIKSAFINKSNTKFLCPISLIKSVTKTNIKILISDIYP